jgi:tellurite resistance protein TerC/cation:H+ antiporter
VNPKLKWALNLLWRFLVLLVGSSLVLVGVVMIVTPGPAIVVIPLGLGILATEFKWARDLLHKIRPWIHAAIKKARQAKQGEPLKKNSAETETPPQEKAAAAAPSREDKPADPCSSA